MLNIPYTRLFFIVIFSFGLVSCGGGSSDSSSGSGQVSNNVPFSLSSIPDGISEKYQGMREPAVLTTELALELFESLYSDLSNETTNIDTNIPSSRPSNSQTQSKGINETTSGQISGNYSLTGNINSTNGELTAIWSNYSNQAGYMIDGKAIYNIVEIDQENSIVKMIVTLINETSV